MITRRTSASVTGWKTLIDVVADVRMSGGGLPSVAARMSLTLCLVVVYALWDGPHFSVSAWSSISLHTSHNMQPASFAAYRPPPIHAWSTLLFYVFLRGFSIHFSTKSYLWNSKSMKIITAIVCISVWMTSYSNGGKISFSYLVRKTL